MGMKIILSPAKKMNVENHRFPAETEPYFLKEAEALAQWMKGLSYEEAKTLWKCSDKLAQENCLRLQDMDLRKNLTPAILAYDGIQYQHMGPMVFSERAWRYVQEHLYILSGFYGLLRPLDGVAAYRLEMQAKAAVNGTKDLYEFWGSRIYDRLTEEAGPIINLASKEYAKAIEPYLKPEDTFITCIFGELKDGRVVQKGTQAKMARGDMVRFLAEKQITDLEGLKTFHTAGYEYQKNLSSEKKYVFLTGEKN